jgi:hypothetical protein
VAARRGVAVDCFEHALGKATARGRYAAGGAVALYEPRGSVTVALPGAVADLDLDGERPDTVTATNRGDLAAALVHLFRGGPSGELLAAADGHARAITDGMPRYGGRVALVLDSSASMRGYGSREWAVSSQAGALRMVLGQVCERLVVVPAGTGGGTDLAGGLLDAAAGAPDVIAVASDGYENVYPGDLARVAAALPGAGVGAPVVFCQAVFGRADDLTFRRAANGLPLRTFWHSADLAQLVLWMLSHVDGDEARRWVGLELRRRLAALENTLGGVPR